MKLNKLNSKLTLIAIGIVITSVLSSCTKKTEEAPAEEMLKVSVKVVNPSTGNLVEYLEVNATTVFQKREVVRATFQGFVLKSFKKIGDAVKPGDEIVKIQTKESYANSGANVDINNKTIKGIVTLKANTDGILTTQNHNTGDYVAEGEQVAEISNVNSLALIMSVPFQSTANIHSGGGCKIQLPDKKIIDGVISKALPSVDATSQTQSYIVNLTKGIALPESLNVIVKIPTQTVNNALIIPKSSIMTDETQSKYWVMKLLNDSTAIKVEIQKGIENGESVQILKPVFTKEDRIIGEGAFGLSDTASVKIGD